MKLGESIEKIRRNTLTPFEFEAELNNEKDLEKFPIFIYLHSAYVANRQEIFKEMIKLFRYKNSSVSFEEIFIPEEVDVVHSQNNNYFSNINSSLLSAKAFIEGIELSLISYCDIILATEGFTLTKEILVKIIQTPHFKLTESFIRNKLPLIEPEQDNQRFGHALAIMRALKLIKPIDNTVNLGKIITICLESNINKHRIFDIFECCRNLQDPTGIESLILFENYKDARLLLKQGYAVSEKSCVYCIRKGKYEFAIEFYIINGWKVEKNIQNQLFDALLEQFETEFPNLVIILYLIRKLLNYCSLIDVKRFIKAAQNIIVSQREDSIKFSNSCLNPILVIVLIMEILKLMAITYPSMNIKITSLTEDLTKLVNSIQNEIESDEDMKLLYKDKDIQGRDTVSIIVENEMVDLLQNAHIESFASEIWHGKCFSGNWSSLMGTSTIWEKIMANSTDEKSKKNVLDCEAHPFEFQSWRNGAFFRIALMTLEYVIIVILVFNFYVDVYSQTATIRNYEKYLAQLEITENVTLPMKLHFVKLLEDVIGPIHYLQISIIILEITLGKLIIEKLYLFITERTISFQIQETLLSLLLLALVQVQIFYYNPMFDLSRWSMKTDADLFAISDYAGAKYRDVTTGALMLILGLRALFSLRSFTVVGPFIQILIAMIKAAGVFIVLFVVLVIIFSMTYSMIIPISYEENANLWRAMVTLFQASTAVYDLNSKDYSLQGEIFYILYVLIFNVILLNFFIAILSDIYSKMSNEATPLYLKEILSKRDLSAPNKRFQFMISSFFGIDSALVVLFLPIYPLLSEETQEKINLGLLYFEYTFAFLCFLPFYITILTILVPFCYLKVAFSKFINVIKDPTLMKMLDSIIFLLVGILILLVYMIIDIGNFTYFCYFHESDLGSANNIYVNNTEIKLLLNSWNRLQTSESKAKITTEKFVGMLLKESTGETLDASYFLKLGGALEGFASSNKSSISHYLMYVRFIKHAASDSNGFSKAYAILEAFYNTYKLRNRYKKHKGFTQKNKETSKINEYSHIEICQSRGNLSTSPSPLVRENKSINSEKIQTIPTEMLERPKKCYKISMNMIKMYSADKYASAITSFFAGKDSQITISEIAQTLKDQQKSIARLQDSIDNIGKENFSLSLTKTINVIPNS